MKKEVLPANKFEKIYRCGEVTSTMDVCEELIKSGVGRGIVVAESQTSGRGRNAKKWVSEANGNIYLSFFDKLNIDFIPQRCAVAALSAVSQFVEKTETVLIKWPNDILVDKRKVAGIIAKTFVFGGRRFYVCGIGVNVFMPEDPEKNFVWKPTAISEFAEVSSEKVLDKLIEKIDSAFSAQNSGIFDIYSEKISWMIGKNIVFSQDLIRKENGRIVDFSDDFSAIKIETADGLKELSALSVLSVNN
ncbi:biotin--[acetyl-CoA-carboxylase] ligase [bacterium]|nr:biotin--[acetyl-CoA-carboxylase] ligase [bacterium]